MTHTLGSTEPSKLLELVDCGPVDLEALRTISGSLIGEAATMAAQFSKNGDQIFASDNAEIGALSSVVSSVQAYQRSHNRLLGVTTINASRIAFNRSHFYPWHSDDIADAFSLSLEASTEGLSGEIDAPNQAAALEKIIAEAETDNELSHIPSLRIVRFPIGHLIKITRGAIHRSPAHPDGAEGSRLLIHTSVSPIYW